jgi:hypothetical protein
LIGSSLRIALLLRTSREFPFRILKGIGRDKLSAFVVSFAEVVKDPLLLLGDVRRDGLDNIKSPFTLGHLPIH